MLVHRSEPVAERSIFSPGYEANFRVRVTMAANSTVGSHRPLLDVPAFISLFQTETDYRVDNVNLYLLLQLRFRVEANGNLRAKRALEKR